MGNSEVYSQLTDEFVGHWRELIPWNFPF